MITFRTFGTLDLSDTDAAATFSVLGHPKRIALLTYLAAASPQGFQRRDTLLAMFWPELDTERARHALNQALYALRQDLGEAVVVSRGQEEVGIDEGALWCDVVAFRQAVEAGSWQEALDVYRGEFLEGFHLSGSSVFEQWLEGERRRLRDQAAEAAWSVAETEAKAGRRTEAAKAARRAAGYARDDEIAIRRLLVFLDELGDRAGAVAAYATFAERLREDYEADPSPETVAIVEAIRAREEANDLPPRVDAERPDRALEGPPAAAPSAAPAAVTPAGSGVSKSTSASATRRRIVVGLLATATAAVAITATWITLVGSGSPDQPQSFSVFPFTVTADSEGFEWLSRGAQNMLAGSLDAWQETRVVDPRILGSLAEARGSRVDAETSLSQALETSEAAGASTLVVGDIVAQANAVEIVVRLYDVSSGQPLRDPIRVVGRAGEDLRPLLDEVAASILLLSGFSGSPPDLRGATTRSLTAYRHYLTGLERFQAYDLNSAVTEFEAAVAEDSTFSLALLHLAWTVVGRNEYVEDVQIRAQELMDRAVRHSDRLSERDRRHVEAYNAHAREDYELARELYSELIEADSLDRDAWYLLADVEYHDEMTVSTADGALYPRANVNLALSGFLRSVEIDPGFHLGYGHALEIMGLLDVPAFTYFLRTEPRAPPGNPESSEDLVYFYLVPGDSLFWVRVQPPPFPEVRRQFQNDSISELFRGRAISLARRWANSTSGSFVPYRELSELYINAREYSLALGAAEEMIRQPTDTVLGHRFMLSSRYLAAGFHDTALAQVERALELFHQNPPVWSITALRTAANIFVATGQPSRALDEIFSFFPEFPPMSWWIPTAEGGIDYSDSWLLMAKAQTLGSSGSGGPELVATVDSLTARWAANHSGADLERIYWAKTPDLAGALILLDSGRLEEWLSHLPDSLPEAEAAQLQPSAWRARLHLQKGSTDAASLALDSALALQEHWGESQQVGSHYVMGLVAQELGRDAEAVELFSRIEDRRTLRTIDGMSPLWGLLTLSYLHRARSYERLGDLTRADEFYERFRRVWAPAEAPVRRYLEEAEEGIQRVRSKPSGG